MPHRQSVDFDQLGTGVIGGTSPRSRNIRSSAHVQRILTEHCHGCESYPCLAPQRCVHEDQLRRLETQCPQGRWCEQIRWVRSVDRTAAVNRLIGLIPPDVTAIAGVPRSGMAAAGQIAEALHLPLYAIHPETGLTKLPAGERLTPDGGASGRTAVPQAEGS